ncbi:PAS domain S-box protein [Undibacterium sp. FT79W]|uniref:PAS domain-containing hybrid sensor histidine kinase/response regulator n=1 Tax=Undibacterium sp. FT79W TaxID=2762296 RepID=UPI00164C2DB4|nr:PAS domain S-box protein [Undibacterium sp. FT79W]MBC3877735.1 PAS domain S-box protein [Undibacterium sp. FT79W]
MKLLRSPMLPYIMGFFLPVALFVLLAGTLNLLSFRELNKEHQTALAETAEDQRKLKLNRNINNGITAIQVQLATLIEQARLQKIDEAVANRIHQQLANQLTEMEQQLVAAKEAVDEKNLRDLQKNFQDYRDAVLAATKLAVTDTSSAMSHTYQATLSQQHISQQVRIVAASLNDQMAQRSATREKNFQTHAIQNVVIGGLLILMLIVIWLRLIMRLTGRLSMLTSALDGLSEGVLTPKSLPDVQVIAEKRGSLLGDLARAVLAFRETSLAHRQAQYDLGERMKELSCLFDILRITVRDDIAIESMFDLVAARLPAAMRFPDMATGFIDCGDKHYGKQASGERLSASFIGIQGQNARVSVVYTAALPADAGAPFIPEEQSLLEAIATHMAAAVERHRIAAEEADRQALIDTVIAEAPDAIELVDMETLRFIEANATSCKLLGYTHEEMLSMRVTDTQATMDTEEKFAELRKNVADHGRVEFENRHRRKDGTVIEVRVNVKAIRQKERDYLVAIWRDITAEKAVAAEIRKLSLVIEQSPNSIIITDLDCRIEYVNDAFTRNTGYTREDVIGKNPRLLKSGKTTATVYDSMWQALTNGTTWHGEFINLDRAGREQIEAAIIVPLRQPDDSISHYVAIKEDITVRKQQENQLRKLILAVEQSPDSIVITDINARIEYVNDAFQRNTGYTKEEAIGINPRVLKSGRTPQSTYDDMWATLSRGEIWRGELVNRRKDQSEYVEFANIAPIRQPDGEITHYLAIKEDITEKKAMLDELERHREHLEQLIEIRTAELNTTIHERDALFDAASTGIVLLKNRIIMRCNRRMDEMLGYAFSEQIGQSTRIWFHDDNAYINAGNQIYPNILHGKIDVREMNLLRKDGSSLWCRTFSRAIDPADPTRGNVVVFEDVTAERAATEQMRAAKTLAENAVRMKSDFLANMSHEIRTPMNAIIGMSHLAMKTELTPRQRDYMKKIQWSSQHLLGIINDILDLSKIEAGKMTVESIDFELDQVLENVIGLISEKAAAKNLELILEIDADVPHSLIGDPLRIGQVLINYANNAVKFTEQGNIAIRVAVARASSRELILNFSVSDTGIGLDEEQRNRLFQSFEQADSSTTRKYGGTGLGLAISRQLVSLMGGEVGVDSKLGTGSTFWFTVPLGHREGKQQQLLPAPDLRGRRVLVIDDNDHAREVIGDMLSNMSFVVSLAPSGLAGIAEIVRAANAGEPYEIVFLDWQMPGLDGIATARKISDSMPMNAPHMVMITAYGRDEVMKAADDARIDDVLIKPVTSSLLFDTAMRILGTTQTSQLRSAEHPAPGTDLAAITGARILLVEDNELNQEVAMELLHQAGFLVDIADNGAIAMNMLNNQDKDYDMVLMDMQMPVMDGVTATREIRKQAKWSALPIIAMTANAMASDRDRCIDAGMNDYLVKPIDPDQLWMTLRRWIKPLREVTLATVKPAHKQSDVVTIAPVAGLDVKAGLHHALGKEALYTSLLRKFSDGQKDFPERLAEAMTQGDLVLAERLAHTFKGLCGQIGAGELRTMAESLEQSIRNREPKEKIQATLKLVPGTLAELVSAIDKRFPVVESVQSAVAVDLGELREISIRLAAELAADDFASSDTFDQHEALMRAALGERFITLASAIHDFNFALAADQLREAMAIHGIDI